MSLILIGFTVDYFGKIQPLFFFVLGSIGWANNYPKLNIILNHLSQKARLKNIQKKQQSDRRLSPSTIEYKPDQLGEQK